MPLETYRDKRDFARTPEPSGRTRRRRKTGNSFVVQKHDATRLHYDFRLEMDGVLKSWAVTRGPSLVPGEKRLAVHVEDHPLEYGGFEGTIPKGEYGGGTVIVWDRGTWKPVGDPKKGYAKGHLELELDGEKLKGRWHLVRMAGRPREKRENWLLIKSDDEFARTESQPDILEERPESVKTGRVVADVEGEEPGWSSRTGRIRPKKAPAAKKGGGATDEPMPDFVAPALATLVRTAPAGGRWLHEIKFDGYRIQARIDGREARLLTRSGLDWTEKFGDQIPKALKGLPIKQAILDGEIVVETGPGSSSFSALQADLKDARSDRMVYYVFDLLYLDGKDLRGIPLVERKRALQDLVAGASSCLRFSEHFEENGDLVLRHACRLSLEGIVSKLRDGLYVSGRGRDWVKSKCSARQEFVVAGYVPSTAAQNAIGSLVMGYYEGGELVHAGRVGTGYSKAVAEDLYRRLEPIRRDEQPFSEKLSAEAKRGVRFVKPELVAEVEFRAWTADHILRHAAFRGLREDKKADEIVREDAPAASRPAPKAPRIKVKLTHPDRIYWEDAGVTKQGLAEYYAQVWPWMAPFVVSRPLALVRCPQGVGGHCFFQKHEWKGQSPEILKARDPADKSEESIVAIDDLDGLIGLVQGATLEIHPWQASLADLERPDQIVMDLDPGDDVAWPAVIAAAREVAERLRAAGLAAFLKTSGGKGLHVVSPLKPAAGWDAVKGFAKGIADSMAGDSPDRYVAVVTKSKRKGKILVDYLRNGRGATAVAPYSSRARPGAPVAMPLAWDELDEAIRGNHFTVENAPARLANLTNDPWADFRKSEVPLKPAKAPRAA